MQRRCITNNRLSLETLIVILTMTKVRRLLIYGNGQCRSIDIVVSCEMLVWCSLWLLLDHETVTPAMEGTVSSLVCTGDKWGLHLELILTLQLIVCKKPKKMVRGWYHWRQGSDKEQKTRKNVLRPRCRKIKATIYKPFVIDTTKVV